MISVPKITAYCLSYDNEYVFIGLGDNNLRQYRVVDRALVKDYGVVVEREIYSISISENNKFIFIKELNGDDDLDLIPELLMNQINGNIFIFNLHCIRIKDC